MSNRTHEVLYESEAALRLVDNELQQLHDVQEGDGDEAAADRALEAEVLTRANAQIMEALVRLRERTAAQPLSDAAELLHEMERRMTAVSELLGTKRPADAGAEGASPIF